MSEKCIVAEFAGVEQAKVGLESLLANGFQSDAVSLVWRDHEQALDHSELSGRASIGEAVEAAAFGGLVAAGLTSPIAIGSVLMPILIVVPFAMFASGALGGLLLYEVFHAGDHAETAKNYHQRLLDGSALIILSGPNERLQATEAILRDADLKSLEKCRLHNKRSS